MNMIYTKDKIINLDNVAYIDRNPYNDGTVGIVFVGSNSDSYDVQLKGADAVNFLDAVDTAAHPEQTGEN